MVEVARWMLLRKTHRARTHRLTGHTDTDTTDRRVVGLTASRRHSCDGEHAVGSLGPWNRRSSMAVRVWVLPATEPAMICKGVSLSAGNIVGCPPNSPTMARQRRKHDDFIVGIRAGQPLRRRPDIFSLFLGSTVSHHVFVHGTGMQPFNHQPSTPGDFTTRVPGMPSGQTFRPPGQGKSPQDASRNDAMVAWLAVVFQAATGHFHGSWRRSVARSPDLIPQAQPSTRRATPSSKCPTCSYFRLPTVYLSSQGRGDSSTRPEWGRGLCGSPGADSVRHTQT